MVAAASADESLTAAPAQIQPADRPKDDGPRQRDKWYEANAKESAAGPSLVDRLQEEKSDPTSDESVTLASELSANSLPSVPNDLNQVALDPLASTPGDMQLVSDVAAALQASVAQSQNTTIVSESSAAGSFDGASRQRNNATAGVGQAGSNSGSMLASGMRSGVGAGVGNGRATGNASETNETTEITQQERVRLVQRVARSFSRLGPDGGQVTLKLHPPQLGVLNVSIKIEGQTMTARLQTESSAARDVIVDNLPVLRERLSEHGIEVEKFQVEVGQQEDFTTSGGQTGSFGSGSNPDQRDSRVTTDFDYRRSLRTSAARAPLPPVLEPKLPTWVAGDRTLDVRA